MHASPVFITQRKLGKDKNGDITVKSRAVKDLKLLIDNTYDFIYDDLIIDDLHILLAGSRLINTTDIKKWFYHILLDEDSRRCAAIRVKEGALIPTRILQGFKNTPIFANKLSSEIYHGLAHCLQDDLHNGIKHEDLNVCKNLALKNMRDIVVRSYDHDVRLWGKKQISDSPKQKVWVRCYHQTVHLY